MKQNKQFFDELDNNWEDALTGIYKEYNKILFYDTRRDINLTIDNQHNTKVCNDLNDYLKNYYEETYIAQDEATLNYKIVLVVYTPLDPNELKLSVTIQNIDVVDSINDNYMNISFYVDEEKTVKDNHPSEIIMIEHNFIRSFLRRAKSYIKLDKDNNTNSSTELYDKFTNDAINLIQDPNMD